MVKSTAVPGRVNVICPCSDDHTGESGESSTVYFLPHFAGVKYGKFHCLHNHCAGRPQERFLEALGLNPYTVWRHQANGEVIPTPGPPLGQPCAGSSATAAPFINLTDWQASKRFSGLAPERQWLIEGVFPLGKPALLAAAGGVGKSFLLLELARKTAAFKPVHHTFICDPDRFSALGKLATGGAAVLLCGEDDAIEVHSRLDALGGPVDRLTVVPLPDAGGVRPLFTLDDKGRVPATTEHFRELSRQLKAIDGLALVAFDPLQALCGGLDLNLPQHAQHVCSELATLATETGATVIASHHFRKTSDIATPEQAREAVRGSGGLVDGVRSVVAVWPLREDAGKPVCQQLMVPWQRGRVVRAAVVKANFRADLAVRTLVRDDYGLLHDRSFDLGQVTPKGEELEEALIKDVAQAAREGHPFTKTGINGIYARRHQLSSVFHGTSRAKLEDLVQTLLNCGRLRTFRTKPGQSSPAWLDVPDGVLSLLPANGADTAIPDDQHTWEVDVLHVEDERA